MARKPLHPSIAALGLGAFDTLSDLTPSGRVAKVRLRATNEIYVLKEVSMKQRRSRPELLRECEILLSLQHPNIVACYGSFWGKDERSLFMVLEYCAGGDLSKEIHARRGLFRQFSEREIWSIFSSVCEAVAAAHARGIVHRDIKPHNILFSADGSVKLCDFGVSRVVTESDGCIVGRFVGTPLYAAPEARQGLPCTRAVDMWALGVVLYELVALVPPPPTPSLNSRPELPPCRSPVLARMMHALLSPESAERPDISTLILSVRQQQQQMRAAPALLYLDSPVRLAPPSPPRLPPPAETPRVAAGATSSRGLPLIAAAPPGSQSDHQSPNVQYPSLEQGWLERGPRAGHHTRHTTTDTHASRRPPAQGGSAEPPPSPPPLPTEPYPLRGGTPRDLPAPPQLQPSVRIPPPPADAPLPPLAACTVHLSEFDQHPAPRLASSTSSSTTTTTSVLLQNTDATPSAIAADNIPRHQYVPAATTSVVTATDVASPPVRRNAHGHPASGGALAPSGEAPATAVSASSFATTVLEQALDSQQRRLAALRTLPWRDELAERADLEARVVSLETALAELRCSHAESEAEVEGERHAVADGSVVVSVVASAPQPPPALESEPCPSTGRPRLPLVPQAAWRYDVITGLWG